MLKKRFRYALVQGGTFGLLMTLIKGLIHLMNKGFSIEWLKYLGFISLIFILGSIILYYMIMWPLMQYLQKQSALRYKKEIEKDVKNRN